MNRTSSEFAISVIFDGLLKAAINFTDVQEASRQASCEDNLIGYLLEEVMPQLHNIHWGKVSNCEYISKYCQTCLFKPSSRGAVIHVSGIKSVNRVKKLTG